MAHMLNLWAFFTNIYMAWYDEFFASVQKLRAKNLQFCLVWMQGRPWGLQVFQIWVFEMK